MDMHGQHPPCPPFPHLHVTLSQKEAKMIGNVYMSHMMDHAAPTDARLQAGVAMVRPMFEEGAAVARDDWTAGAERGESRMGGLMAEVINFAEYPPESFAPADEE